MTFHQIAYAGLAVANPVGPDVIEAMARETGLATGAGDGAADGGAARALDIGAGAGGVSVMLAGLGMDVTAVERDPAMAGMIRARTAAAGAADRVTVRAEGSAAVLGEGAAFDLIVALGTIQPAGPGVRAPEAVFKALAKSLRRPGWLLWGDLTWTGDAPEPLTRIVALSGDYATDEGWRAAARAAGYVVQAARLSTAEDWRVFLDHTDGAARAWLGANADHPDAAAVRARADQVKAMFEVGRDCLGFGLYLLSAD